MFPPCFTMFDRKERYSTQKIKIEKKDMQLVRNSSGTHKKKKGIVVVNPQVSIASM